MKTLLVFAALLSAVCAQAPYYSDEPPKPYSFSYVAEGEEGTSTHQETSDGSGRVQGSYSLTDIEGNNRIVEYVADAEGYRATVRTNEPGTDNRNPADVIFESSAQGAGAAHRSAAVSTTSTAREPTRYASGGGAAFSGGAAISSGAVGAGARVGTQYILVPVTDPRAQGYL